MPPHICCNKQEVKRGPWTPEEDEVLKNYIMKNGHDNSWSYVPTLAGLQRCGKSCRLRWTNYLRPDLKRGSMTEKEASVIRELHAIVGNKWAQIATQLPGRTDNEVKNYWNSSLKKQLSQQKKKQLNSRNPVPIAPNHQASSSRMFQTSNGSSAQNVFFPTASDSNLLNPIGAVQQVLPITTTHIFQANPNTQFTVVALPVQVYPPISSRMDDPPIIDFRSLPSVPPPAAVQSPIPLLHSPLCNLPSTAVTSDAASPCKVRAINLDAGFVNDLDDGDAHVYIPEMQADDYDPEKLNSVVDELKEVLAVPPQPTVQDQVADPAIKAGLSSELVVPDFQFPDDITEVEPLVITSFPSFSPPPTSDGPFAGSSFSGFSPDAAFGGSSGFSFLSDDYDYNAIN